MTSRKSIALLLVLIGILTAFNTADYLYPNEQNATLSYENFTQDGNQYSIVSINSNPAFILQNGEPMTNSSGIGTILHTYFLQKYYPSQDQIDNLLSLIQQFNNSRNDGYDFKGKEEYLCRNDVLMSGGKINFANQNVTCRDNATCYVNAQLLYAIYGEGLNLQSADVILQPLEDFDLSSFYIDDVLTNYTTMLNNANESTISDTISYIVSTADPLQTASYKVENNIFRTPRLNDSVDRQACMGTCWAICPSFQLDHAAIAQIKANATAIKAEIAPISGYASLSDNLYNSTVSRILNLKTQNTAAYYQDTFQPLNQSGTNAINEATIALIHVQNQTLSNKLDALKSLSVTIPQNIQLRNFTTMDSDISAYTSLTSDVMNGSVFLLSAYNDTRNAKNAENSLELILETKDLDPVSLKSLETLQNQTDDLNLQFRDGMTLSQLQDLQSNYTSLSSVAQGLLNTESNTPATKVLLEFRSFARKVNTGLADAAQTTNIIAPADIATSPIPLGLFSAVIFLSFSSIVFLIFLSVIATHKFRVPKTGHILGAALIALMVILLVFSVFMFLVLGKTSNQATLPEFLSDFSTRNSTAIVVDLRNASFSDSNAMKSCASTLANSLVNQNKTWSIYTLTPSSCGKVDESGANTSLSSTDCQSNISVAESSFVLGYSPVNQPPKLSITYQNRAEILANGDYYASCPLVALFS